MCPSMARFHAHVMDLSTDVSIPSCLGMQNCMRNVTIEALEVSSHGLLGCQEGQGVGVFGGMENLVVFFEQLSKCGVAHLEPSVTLALVVGGS